MTRRVLALLALLVLAALPWAFGDAPDPADEPYPTPPIACCEWAIYIGPPKPQAPATPFPEPVRGVMQ
jgi:hypothetical protein